MMKIFVINMKKSNKRKQKILDQFDKFNITNFEFIDALDESFASDEYISTIYNDVSAKNTVRSMSKGEICTTFSHHLAYKKILEEPSDNRCLILEDDVIITQKFIDNFKELEFTYSDIDIIKFSCFSSNTHSKSKSYKYEMMTTGRNEIGKKCRCYFKKDHKIILGNLYFHKYDEQSYKVDFLTGAHAFSPSKSACKRLLDLNTPIRMSSDLVWSVCPYFTIYGSLQELIYQDVSLGSYVVEQRKEYSKEYSLQFTNRIKQKSFGT